MPISHSFYSPTTSCLSPDDAIERDVSVRVDFNLSGDGFVSAANRARGGLIVVVCEASMRKMSATGYEPHKLMCSMQLLDAHRHGDLCPC